MISAHIFKEVFNCRAIKKLADFYVLKVYNAEGFRQK
jgi:hypothetical protein